MWQFAVLIIIYVALLFLARFFAKSLVKPPQENASLDLGNIRQIIQRLAAYFGTCRPDWYDPDPSQEAREIAALLDQCSGSAAQSLAQVARNHGKHGILPDPLAFGGCNFCLYDNLIHGVREELYQRRRELAGAPPFQTRHDDYGLCLGKKLNLR